MNRASFRFYACLNDFLPLHRRQVCFSVSFRGRPSIKDLIESLGVPHTEVDLVLVNGDPVSFAHRTLDGDRVSVYPAFESFEVTSVSCSERPPITEPRFVLDNHLGKLASYLRLLGFDSVYSRDYSDGELASISSKENRVLLTRDRGLLKRRVVSHGYCLRWTAPAEQLAEVISRFDFLERAKPFHLCLLCNFALVPASKAAVLDRLPPQTSKCYEEFHLCQSCGRVYWKGPHYQSMERFIARMTGSLRTT